MKNIISTVIISCVASSVGFSAHAIIDAVNSSQKVFVDNREVTIEAYNIAGSNYYKLRDLGDTLGFSVDYDERSNSVMINTDKKTETTKPHYTAPDGTVYYPGDIYVDEYGTTYRVDNDGDLVTQAPDKSRPPKTPEPKPGGFTSGK